MKVEAVYEGGQLRFLKPVTLREARVRVVVEIPDEAVSNSDPYAGLDEQTLAMVAALDAIRKWRFSPGQKDGQPVRTYIRVPMRFRVAAG